MNPKRLTELREALIELSEWSRIELTMENDVPTREVWRQINDWAEGMARTHNLTLK